MGTRAVTARIDQENRVVVDELITMQRRRNNAFASIRVSLKEAPCAGVVMARSKVHETARLLLTARKAVAELVDAVINGAGAGCFAPNDR